MKKLLLLLLALLGAHALHAAPSSVKSTGSLYTPRYAHTASLLASGAVLVAGGTEDTGVVFASAELYNPATGTWGLVGSLKTARVSHAAVTLLNGKILAVGGVDSSYAALRSAELYDPATKAWTATGSMAVQRNSSSTTLLADGKVLVTGGYNASGFLTSAELYDPATGVWTATGSLMVARAGHTATLLKNGKVLVEGGNNTPQSLQSSEIYDPATGAWANTHGSPHSARRSDTATGDRYVTVAGGTAIVDGVNTALDTVELYIPDLDAWVTETHRLLAPRRNHTAALLPNGDILLVGGRNGSGILQTNEVQSHDSGEWHVTSSLASPRTSHTMTLLKNGSILVVGGSGATGVLGSAEVYIPATPAQAQNVSTRLNVLTGNDVLIGGFIITGNAPKKVMIRGIGPSLPVGNALANPVLELHKPDGTVVVNDDWKIDSQTGQSQEAAIRSTQIQPANDLESALLLTLAPGAYTAVVRGKDSGTGVGIVEAYDLTVGATSKLANISTRGLVGTESNVLIGGFIVGPEGSTSTKFVIRGLGPSLPFPTDLQNPYLELHDGNGAIVASNDNWQSDSGAAEMQADMLNPTNPQESALLRVLQPGSYTVILSGVDGTTGEGLFDLYSL